MKLFEAVNNACRDLPEGYHINLHMENGCGCIELFDFEGEEVKLELCDLDLAEQINKAVFAAKESYSQCHSADSL